VIEFDLSKWDAVLFDLDGVITQTAKIHAAAWKQSFDQYLRERSARSGEPFVEFVVATDYKQYVDGKLRQDGVRGFLLSRGIDLPEGDASDAPDRETVHGVGNRKNRLVVELIETQGVETYECSVKWARFLHGNGIKTAVVSASKNCEAVLRVTHIEDLFDYRMDGNVAAALKLPGKPAPDTFLAAAKHLGVEPSRAVVVEDAIAGVESGKAGGFGLVIGVDRKGDPESLSAAGADIVVQDLGEFGC
jgi:beta-phosphoglucomutase family hydrolase